MIHSDLLSNGELIDIDGTNDSVMYQLNFLLTNRYWIIRKMSNI